MKWVKRAIETVTNPEASESSRTLEMESLRKYYNENLPAHLEYLEKGIYDAFPLNEFRSDMETIQELIHGKAVQMRMF